MVHWHLASLFFHLLLQDPQRLLQLDNKSPVWSHLSVTNNHNRIWTNITLKCQIILYIQVDYQTEQIETELDNIIVSKMNYDECEAIVYTVKWHIATTIWLCASMKQVKIATDCGHWRERKRTVGIYKMQEFVKCWKRTNLLSTQLMDLVGDGRRPFLYYSLG